MTYSTPLEFNNSINSRKSFGSICGLTVSLNQFEQDLQALRRSQSRVIPAVRFVRLFETREFRDRVFDSTPSPPTRLSAVPGEALRKPGRPDGSASFSDARFRAGGINRAR